MKKHGNHGEERDEHMARLKAEYDDNGLPYPPELVQHQIALQKRLHGQA